MTYFQKIRCLYGLEEDENAGFPEAEITQLEAQLQIRLPDTLREYYLTLAKHEAINYSFNRLLKPGGEIGVSTDNHLVFYEENQAVAYWAILKSDLQDPNPPVYGNYSSDELHPDWHLELPATDACLLMFAVYNGVLGGLKYNANYLNPVNPTVIRYIEENREEPKDVSNPGQRIFTQGYREMISLSIDFEQNPSGIFIGTNDQTRFNYLLEHLAADWHYISTENLLS